MEHGKTVSIYLDDKTLGILKSVAEEKGLMNVSATVRYIIREWYEKVYNGEQ